MYPAEELPDATGYLAKHQPQLIWVFLYYRSAFVKVLFNEGLS